METFIDADQFVAAFQKELVVDVDVPVTFDSRLVEDLGFDSLQMLLAAEFLSELIGDCATPDDHELIAALETVRSAHNFYLTQKGSPPQGAPDRDSLTGSLVVLRPPQPAHYAQLYDIATANEIAWRWRYSGAIPTYDEFLRTFSAGVLTQLVVCRRREQQQASGVVAAYNANLLNRTAYLAATVAPNLVTTGAGVEAVVLFLRYLFRTWDFEKVYMEVPEYNLAQFSSGLNRDFVPEGQLRRHLYHDGRRWDQFIFAIYRSTFLARWGDCRAQPTAHQAEN
jgi:RimJ/RimL family protein N-acetyltransferase/acyl carrier protein